MQHTSPFPDHPEFSIIAGQGWREYRIETPRRRRGIAGKIPTLGGLWIDASLVCGLACYWGTVTSTTPGIVALSAVLFLYAYTRSTQIQWESVVILPSLGVQFETHKGFAGISLLAARKFISWASLEDFLINEGLHGWNVRYYCVAVSRTPQGSPQLEVAFENLLPRFPILLEVYRGVQEALQVENEQRGERQALNSIDKAAA